MSSILIPMAKRFNLSIDAFGGVVNGTAEGRIVLSDAFGTGLDPSPKTPTFGSGPWELLSGTIMATVTSSIRTEYSLKGVPVIVAPTLSLGAFAI